ncbi:MAG: PTS sugar transporter subunit IIA [Rubrivivax sp.]|nr:PTS sugar transporter subunit IIA [Rubrivivax sp.]
MNVKLLPGERILLDRRVGSEAGLFAVVARAVAGPAGRLDAPVRERLARRHARRSVALGGGFALPHAAVPGLTTTCAVYVRSSTPIPMSAPDGCGVTDALALLVPLPGLAADYDRLMGLTSLLGRPATRVALLQARTAREVQAILMGTS